jgi:hypothetical protein
MVYQEWAYRTLNPLEDSSMEYMHECVLISADIDLGAARLPKFFKEIGIITENLDTGIEIHLDYQVDEHIGTSTWFAAETFYVSPEDSLPINWGDARKLRFRLRLCTNDASTPPIVDATVVEAFARTPVKYQWNMRVKISDMQITKSGNPDHDPDEIMTWFKGAAGSAKRIHMRSIWKQMDDKFVVIEPPSLMREFANTILKWWGGVVTLTVREA